MGLAPKIRSSAGPLDGASETLIFDYLRADLFSPVQYRFPFSARILILKAKG
jgi:hypothetical protein